MEKSQKSESINRTYSVLLVSMFHACWAGGRAQVSPADLSARSCEQLICVRVQMDVTKRVRFAATQKVQRRRQDEDLSRYPCRNASRLHFHRFSVVSTMLAPCLNQNFVFLLFALNLNCASRFNVWFRGETLISNNFTIIVTLCANEKSELKYLDFQVWVSMAAG